MPVIRQEDKAALATVLSSKATAKIASRDKLVSELRDKSCEIINSLIAQLRRGYLASNGSTPVVGHTTFVYPKAQTLIDAADLAEEFLADFAKLASEERENFSLVFYSIPETSSNYSRTLGIRVTLQVA